MYFNVTHKCLHKLIIPALVFIALTAPSAWATSSIKTRFLTAYGLTTSSRLATINGVSHCGACHLEFSSGNADIPNLNPYGLALQANAMALQPLYCPLEHRIRMVMTSATMTEIKGTGYSNIPTFPGLRSANVNLVGLPTGITLADLTGFLTPAAAADTAPPTPNPATFATLPNATGTTSIAMVATTGTDASGPVQYLFTETSGNPGATSSAWQTSTSYTDTGLSPSTQYTYRVTMRDNLGNTGTASAAASATTNALADTAPPTPNPATFATLPNATGTTSIAMVATTGTDASGPVQYLFTETSGNPGATSSAWQTSTSYTDTGLSPSTQYTYRVTMRDNLGNTGTASAAASATTNALADTAPPTPNPATFATLPNATGTTSIAMVATTGTDASGPVQYLFTETSGNPGATSSAWQTSTSYTDTGLSPSTQYTYRVTMRDNLGNTGTASAAASATTNALADTAPPTPNPATFATLPNATGTTSIAMVATTGTDASGPVQYLFTETSGNPGATSSAWQTSTSYTDTGLSPSTQYTYRVTMRDNLGNTGTASAAASATTEEESSAYWKLDNGISLIVADSNGVPVTFSIIGGGWGEDHWRKL